MNNESIHNPAAKTRGILFSRPMAQAIRDGRKTQTRRLIRASRDVTPTHPRGSWCYVKETIYIVPPGEAIIAGMPVSLRTDPSTRIARHVLYAADLSPSSINLLRRSGWRATPSMTMPRWAARHWLHITSAYLERLHDIPPADAIAEGITMPPASAPGGPVGAYRSLWCALHGQPSWDTNPTVWVYTFTVHTQPGTTTT